MARLKVRLRGQILHDILLAEEREYIVGRKEDCDIVLPVEKGISREHIKISSVEGVWTVDLVSRYGELIHRGEQSSHFVLDQDGTFSIPPFEFDFFKNSEVQKENRSSSSNLPAVTGVHEVAFGGDDEKTVVGAPRTSAYIKVTDPNGGVKEMIQLDAGDSWFAGRDPSCQIQINDQRVSRRQFELRLVNSQYAVVDLGSVNGTLVNGNPISTSEPLVLKSGDAISVLDNYFYFELHDASFQSRLELVVAQPMSPLVPGPNYGQAPMTPMPYPQQQYPAPYHGAYPAGVVSTPGLEASNKFDFQKNRPKIIAGAVALLVVAYFFSGGESQQSANAPTGAFAPGSPQDVFAKLKPEQQALVRQRYKDAKNLYMQGKYQLAQDEIIKIQELAPDYEDIREIERLSKEAIYIQDQQRRHEELEKAKAENEAKIQTQVAQCRKIINPAITVAQMDECVSPVLQFGPEHPGILDLRAQVETIVADREAKEAEREAYQERVARLRSLYNKAQSVQKTGAPLDAIAAYEKVVESSLPDPNRYKDQSQRTIASIRSMMNSKTASLQAEADKFYQAQNLRMAIMTLRKARKIDPTNDELPEKIEKYTVELRKQMMSLYQEGILEESFGNVEGGETRAGAKDKWKKILELDVADGEYYKKAYIKLKKYGAL